MTPMAWVALASIVCIALAACLWTNYVLLSSQGALDFANSKKTYLNGTAGFYLGLFTGTPTFSVPPVIGDITECGFPGYARQASNTYGAAVTNASPPDADIQDAQHTFTCTGAGSSNTYGGSFLIDASTGGNLIMVTKGNTGVGTPFNASGVTVYVTPRITEASYQNYP